MKRMLVWLLPCLLLGAAGQAFAAPADGALVSARRRGEVSEVRGLLLTAIDAKDGRASARLAGPMALRLRAETKAPSATPIMVDVSTVRVFRPGCKRLRMTFSMPSHKMATVNGTMEPFVMFYDLNLCRDGQPPQISPVGLGKSQGGNPDDR